MIQLNFRFHGNDGTEVNQAFLSATLEPWFKKVIQKYMASDQSFVEYICEQASLASALSYRKMFGEYALYLDGKVIALVCDNQLFVKPTVEGRTLLGSVAEHPPYPGAKPHFRIDDELEEGELLQRLFKITAKALPMPKPKLPKCKAKGVAR